MAQINPLEFLRQVRQEVSRVTCAGTAERPV